MSEMNTENFIVKVSVEAIQGNISSTIAAQQGSNAVNKELTELNAAWTTCSQSNSTDPGNAIYLELQKDKGSAADMDTFIKHYIDSASVTNANKLSSAFITSVIVDLQSAYVNFHPSSSTPGNLSTDLAACNAMNTLISSTATNETQPLQTTARTYGTLLQQCQSATTTLAGIGDLANDCNGSLIALISQQY
ncbi:MAG TPA: hypothetical protein VLE96_05730 [Chlamydiales bacterium]|nr:hypothetical protein [Chlamydiales bacterium]